MPLFTQAFRARWWVVAGAALTNIAVVALWGAFGGFSGPKGAWIASAGVFGSIVLLSIAFLFFQFRGKRSPEVSALLSLLMVGAAVGFALLWLIQVQGWSWQNWVTTELAPVLDQLRASAPNTTSEEVADLQQSVLRQLPSGFVGLAIVMLWANFLMMSRLFGARFYQRTRLPIDYFSRWRVPEFLVWPAIASGALVLFGSGLTATIGLNILNVFFVLYGFQGLSCLTFLLDRWKVAGFPRVLIFVLAVWPMSMALVTAGFLDLWFDFRGKLVQSNS